VTTLELSPELAELLETNDQWGRFADWLPEERMAFRPPEKLSVSDWADHHRVLPTKNQAEPGPWETSRTPYLREIMDAMHEPEVREVTFCKSTQVGGTEALLNCLGWSMDQDPDPAVYLMPTDKARDDFMRDRVKPMIDLSPRLRPLKSSRKADWKKDRVDLPGMTLWMLTSGSATELASRAVRWVFQDEVDKYPISSGREADPCSLVEERSRTFKDQARIVRASTPTTKSGRIWPAWEKSDQRRFHIPCPHCGTYQVLEWAQVKFPEDVRDPQRILDEDLAWYECKKCSQRISDAQKIAALQSGVWVAEGAKVNKRGKVTGTPRSKHRGYHIWAAYSPWIDWATLVATFLELKNKDLQNWVNSWLGEPWVEKDRETTDQLIISRKLDYEAGHVPEDAVALTAGIDVQDGRRFYVAVRAWAPGFRSWLVEALELHGYEQLTELMTESAWPKVGTGEAMEIRLAFVDSGSGSHAPEVYRWARQHPAKVRPSKGYRQQAEPLRRSRIDARGKGKRRSRRPRARSRSTRTTSRISLLSSCTPGPGRARGLVHPQQSEHRVRPPDG
jgi:phage terminase large subunit GpA-like protein